MITENKYPIRLIFIFVLAGMTGFILPVAASAQSTLSKAVAAHIKKNSGDGAEYRAARKIVYGDVDGDGVKDAVLQYTIEGEGGGNSFGQYLAVFLNKKGSYRDSAPETVGGKFYRGFTLQIVRNREIIGATETCRDEGDPVGICPNPKRGKTAYTFKNVKLKEKP
jgi:hypothetical protein